MSSVLKNFVTIRKTRGDVLNPTAFRTIVEMIKGMLREFNYAEFNTVYQSFLAHLADFNDPHHVTQSSFFENIVEDVYAIYIKMLQTPLSLDDFKAEIVPTLGFLELLRRIVLNRYLYNQVKSPDGSVAASVTAILNQDWGHPAFPRTPVTINFGTVSADETAFLKRAWNANHPTIQYIFNAANLDVELYDKAVMFHTSTASPNFTMDDQSQGYQVSIFGSSNDLSGKIITLGAPTVKTVVLSLKNGTNTFSISVSPDHSLEIKMDTTVLSASIPCNDGQFNFSMTRKGHIEITASNDSIASTTVYNANFTTVSMFVTAVLGAPVATVFSSGFRIKELTIFKDSSTVLPAYAILPIFVQLPPLDTTPLFGTTASNVTSSQFIATPGYNLYLTLSGTWTGEARISRTIDEGETWTIVTASEGASQAIYTRNCDESVCAVTDPLARYRIQIFLTSGTVTYRLGQ